MAMTDPIADMLTRIRNAQMRGKSTVRTPASKLRAWVLDVDSMLSVKSELHQEIDRRFRQAKIEIAFPQRDLHLRSVAESAILRPPENVG